MWSSSTNPYLLTVNAQFIIFLIDCFFPVREIIQDNGYRGFRHNLQLILIPILVVVMERTNMALDV